jgi:dCMP deaminase
MVFIAGSREISQKRFLSLFKHYAAKDDVTFGFYKEEFIEGFEGQPQFRSNKFSDFEKLVLALTKKLETGNRKLEIVQYSQKEEIDLIRKLKPRKCVFINGSWKIVFHRRPVYDFLTKENISYSLKSPFESEEEAREYSENIKGEVEECISALVHQCSSEFQSVIPVSTKRRIPGSRQFRDKRDPGISSTDVAENRDDIHFLELAKIASYRSFDYTWQTGAVLVKDGEPIIFGHNAILPYETFMMHHGSLKEHGLGKHSKVSHIHDLNVNETLHAEMHVLSQLILQKLNIENCTLYTNLMPCPNCARMLAASGIKRVVCAEKHFGGYAEELFLNMGVRLLLL